MPAETVVPFLPKSALFITGMTARCPALSVVVAHASNEERVPAARRQVIIEKLFRSLPALPEDVDVAEIASLAALTEPGVVALGERQRSGLAVALREVWERSVMTFVIDAEREFARRCGTLLTELFLGQTRTAGLRLASSCKNA